MGFLKVSQTTYKFFKYASKLTNSRAKHDIFTYILHLIIQIKVLSLILLILNDLSIMEKQIIKISGKTGSDVEGTTYRVIEDENGTNFLYLIKHGFRLEQEMLIGLVDRINKRGLVAYAYSFTGKPLKFVLDRQYFEFEEK